MPGRTSEELFFPDAFFQGKQIQDKLEELWATGIHLAGEKLSLFLMENTETELTGLFSLPFSSLLYQLQHDQVKKTGVHSRIYGDIRGELYLCLSEENAVTIVNRGLKQRRRKLPINSFEESFLSEMANILINTFWSVLEKELAIGWRLTPPVFVADILKSLRLAGKIYTPDRRVLLAEIGSNRPEFLMELIFIPVEHSWAPFCKTLIALNRS